MAARHPLSGDPDRLSRCPAGCGTVVNFSLPLPACADCGKRLCLNCVRWWAADEGNQDLPLCKDDWRTRQISRSRGGGVDKEADT